MKPNLKLKRLALVMATLTTLGLQGCIESDSDNDPTATEQTLKIPFTAMAGETEIACGTSVSGLGASDTSGQFEYAAWFVYDVKLVTDEGDIATEMVANDFQNSDHNFAFLEYRNKLGGCTSAVVEGEEALPMNDTVTVKATVIPSEVKGIKFKLGMPYEANHVEETKFNDKSVYAMLWQWQSGHRFVRVDLKTDTPFSKPDSSTADVFNFHLGSTGCAGDLTGTDPTDPHSCAQPNNDTVFTLTNDQFVINENGTGTKVKFDYAKLVDGMDLTKDEGGSNGCMSALTDPECTPMFYNLGIPLKADPVKPGNANQQVFSLKLN